MNKGSHVILKASSMALLTFAMLLSAAGLADDAKSSSSDAEPLPVVTLSAEELSPELGYASRWRLLPTAEAMAYSDNWPRPLADSDFDIDLNFQDTSALARASKVGGVSLLTLAEVGQSRLFLGVNHDGLVGLHFGAFPRSGDGRYLEVVRMPYLKKTKPDSAATQLGPESN